MKTYLSIWISVNKLYIIIMKIKNNDIKKMKTIITYISEKLKISIDSNKLEQEVYDKLLEVFNTGDSSIDFANMYIRNKTAVNKAALDTIRTKKNKDGVFKTWLAVDEDTGNYAIVFEARHGGKQYTFVVDDPEDLTEHFDNEMLKSILKYIEVIEATK